MAQTHKQLRSSSRLLALEPRLLFDGAAVAAAQDAIGTDDTHQTEAAKQSSEKASEHSSEQKQLDFDGSFASVDAVNVVIIDSRVPQLDELVADLKAGGAQVHVVQANESGLTAISNALAQAQNADSLHIISHGSSGSITLGTDTINSSTLQANSAQVQDWAYYLTQNADILLYGCDVAAGEQGQAFIQELATLSSADIAASTDATGAAAQGGNWVLEARTGSIEAGSALSAQAMAAFADVLADTPAKPTATDKSDPQEPTYVPENAPEAGQTPSPNPYLIAKDIEITGVQASDQLTVVVQVGKGSLVGADAATPGKLTLTGTASEIEAKLAALEYRYTGISETGDADTLTLTIVNTGSGAGSSAPVTFTRNFQIAPVNDAPVLTPPAAGTAGHLVVSEGETVRFTAATGSGTTSDPVRQINLGLIDPDNSQAQIIIKITELPTDGKLYLNNNELTVNSALSLQDIGNLKYVHSGKDVPSATTDGFKINVDDGAGGLLKNQLVSIDILPVNKLPEASGTITLIEGEQNVSLVGGVVPVLGTDRGDISISDADSADQLFTITITNVPIYGTLMYNGDAVAKDQVLSNLSKADLAKFTYTHDGSETTADSFGIKVTDQGGGTGTPDTSPTEQIIKLNIIPNNDDPYWVTQPDTDNKFAVEYGPNSTTSSQNTATLTLNSSILQVKDIESDANRLTYTLTSIPTDGYLRLKSDPTHWLPVGYSFTQADIDAGNILFVSTTGSDHTSEFKFTIMDGDRRLIPNERDGGIYASNDEDAQLTEHTLVINYKGNESGPGVADQLSPAAINEPGGSMSITADDIAEGQTFTLSNTQLLATDSNAQVTDDQLVYRLLSLPDNGKIMLTTASGPVELGIFGSFTQADINAGNVKFVHDGSENFTSEFTFDVSNGTKTTTSLYGVSTFHIGVKPQNDTPVAGQGEDIKLTEGGSIVINAGGKTHITLSDADNTAGSDKSDGYAEDNSLSFEVTVLPTHGDLYLSDVKQTGPFTVTQEQLDAGLLTYKHDGSENYTDSFTIVPVDDRGVGGTTNNTDANDNKPSTNPTNQSSTGEATTIKIGVNPLNDAPTYVDKNEPGYDAPAITEGSTITIWGASGYSNGSYGTGSGTAAVPNDPNKPYYLVYQDSDNSSEQRQYVVTTAPKYGTLIVNGRTLSVGSVFTQAELDAGLVKYTHSGSEIMSDSFFYVVRDGDYSANDTTAFAQGAATTSSEFRIRLEHANDAPTISTSHTGLLVVDSSDPAKAVPLPSITLADIDLKDGVDTAGGEVDFVQVTVQFQDATGADYLNGILNFQGGTTPSGVTVTNAAGDHTLVFQGTLANVQAALNNVVARTNGVDADRSDLQIKITVDDRLRNASGQLTGTGANGGDKNEGGALMGDTFNTASIVIKVAASDKNDAPVLTLPSTPTVNEDARTLLTGISYNDPDAFDSEQTVTLTVEHGTLYLSATGTGLPEGVKVTGGAIGSNQLILTGSQTALNDALSKLYYLSDQDYNGADQLAIDVDDGDANGKDDNEGDSSTSQGTLNISIKPVNDKPVIDTFPSGIVPITNGNSYDFNGQLSFNDNKDFRPSDLNMPAEFDDAVNHYNVTLTVSSGTLTVQTPGNAGITGDGTGSVVLTGTRADINAALDTLKFETAADNGDAIVTFTMTVDDGNNGGSQINGVDADPSATKSFKLVPTTKNDKPEVNLAPTSPNTYTENGTAVRVDSTATLHDPELSLLPSWNGATLTIQRDGTANAEDVFSLGVSATLSDGKVMVDGTQVGTATNTGGVLTITFNDEATDALVQKVVQAVHYANSSEAPPESVTLRYTVNDQSNHPGDTSAGTGQDQGSGGPLTGDDTITLNITRVVDKPVVSAPPAKSAEFTENGSAVVVDNGFTITDLDDDNIYSVQVKITGKFLAGDVLNAVTTGTNISASYDANTGTLTLTGVDSKAHYNQVLQSLTYKSTSEDPTNDTQNVQRTLTYTVYDNGSAGAGTAGGNSTTATRHVDVIPVNDAPLLSGGGSTKSYTENDPAITLESGLTLSDADDTQYTKVTVQITAGKQTDDVLGVTGTLPAGWSKSYNPTTGTLTISGAAADKAAVEALLTQVTFINTGDNPGNADRTITWTVTDANSDHATNGVQTSNVVTTTVHVTPVNDPPVATPDNNSVTEDSTTPVTGNVKDGTSSNGTTGTADSDPDNNINDVPVTSIKSDTKPGSTAQPVADNSGKGTVVQGEYGTLTIYPNGSYSYQLDNSNPTVNQLGSTSPPLTEQFSYTITDPSGASDSSTLTITINGHDDPAPTITPVDGNDTGANEGDANGHNTVYESGLTSSGKPGESKTTNGAITVTAPGQLDTVEIGGQSFTVQDLLSYTPGKPSAAINTGEGSLVITGFTPTYATPGDSTTPIVGGSISYTYTLTTAQTHNTDNNQPQEVYDTIALKVTDKASGVPATGNLLIAIVDDVPEAKDDSYNTLHNVPVKDSVLKNDYVNKDGVTAVNDTSPANGTLVFNSDGSFTYTPNAGFSGQDSFDYTITDADGDTSRATVTITVVPNDVPVASNDSTSTKVDTPVSGDLSSNDKPSNDGGNIWTVTTPPGNGTVAITPDGHYTYTPKPGFSGEDTFTYTITDKDGDTSTATVTVTVTDVPKANDDAAKTTPDTPVSGDLTGNDVPSKDGGNIWTVTTPPGNGTVTITPDGHYTYTPKPGFSGEDTFTYTITDKDGDTSTATVTITVNDVPKANDDVVKTTPNTPVSGDLTGNDIPSTDGGNTWTVATPPGNGTVTITPDGHYTYTPKPGFSGEDTFTYTITDKNGDTGTATVTVTVTMTDVPKANDDAAKTTPNTPVSGDLAGNDIPSKDGGNIWKVATPPGNGTVTITPDGHYTYTPKPGFSGEDTFTYTITDKDGDTSTATVTITVNDVPKANDDVVKTTPDTPVSGDLAGNDTPSKDGGNTWTVTTPPGNGTVTITPDGHYTYTPKPGFSGEDTFTYTITDKDGDTSTATVTVTVVNNTPNPLPLPLPTPGVVVGGSTGSPTPGADGLPNYVSPPGIPTIAGQPSIPLFSPSSSPLSGDFVYTPSVFWEGHDQHRPINLPIPLHPITFVNNEVQRSQAERDEYRGANVLRPHIRASSIGMGLGMDPTVFVLREVRLSQQESQHREDRAAPTLPNLPVAPPGTGPELDTVVLPSTTAQTAQLGEQIAQEETDLLNLMLEARAAQATHHAAAERSFETTKTVSASFREQLKASAHKLPSQVI